MSNARQGLGEFWQAQTMRARAWLVGSLFVLYTVVWWFWSESSADRLAFAWFVVFAVLWVKDGERRSLSDEALHSR